MTQKFQKGDLVGINTQEEGIIIGSYAEQFPQFDPTCTDQYTIHIKGRGECSWFSDRQLGLIEEGQRALLSKWRKERKAEIKQKSDLDWIFKNGQKVIDNPHGASIQALANCFGLTNLWGRNGEGFVWQQNARFTMSFATWFLKTGDKDLYLKVCEDLQQQNNI